jgi:hypothetical protein
VKENLLKQEEIYTIIFFLMFIVFLYEYGTYTHAEYQTAVLSRDSIKIGMWLSALFAIVAHLMPKNKQSG